MPDYHKPIRLKTTIEHRFKMPNKRQPSIAKLLRLAEATKPEVISRLRRLCRFWAISVSSASVAR